MVNMRYPLSFTTVLVAALSTLSVVEAVPAPHNGVIHIPLSPVSRRSPDGHPEIKLQQHMNSAFRRLARMTGSAQPTKRDLTTNLIRRLYYLPKPEAEVLHKRYQGTSAAKDALNEYRNRNSKRDFADILKLIQDEKDNGGDVQDIIDQIISQLGGELGDGGDDTNFDPFQQDPSQQDPSQSAPAKEVPPVKGAAPGQNTGFSPVEAAAAKNGGLTKADPPTDKDSIGLDIEANDVGYVGTITIGTPPRKFKMLMDSGSADMWVGSENCQSTDGGDCGAHTFLGPQSSSTFKDSGKPFAIQYGSGNVQGTIVTDNISLGQVLSLKGHIFGVSDVESPDFTSDTTSFDGLIGLAQSTLSTQKVLTPVEALAKQNLIAAPITSYKLGRVSDQNNDGQITFGGLDKSKFDPKSLITVENVNQKGFWESNFAIKVEGKDLGLRGRTAILDTGTTLIIAPPADAEAIHAAIPGAKSDGQGGFIIPCTTNVNVAFNFGGRDFSIDPRDLTFLPRTSNLQGDCISGISSGQVGGANTWLVGDVFLKNVYFSHDVSKNSVSLANLI